MGRLVPALQRRIERLAGKSIRAAREIQRGYTPALRLVVTFFDGTSAFVKVATNELTAGWLRREHHVYRSISAPFMPRLLGWNGDGGQPILMLEDLSEADWPPPWNE